jgi:hypothetical protein
MTVAEIREMTSLKRAPDGWEPRGSRDGQAPHPAFNSRSKPTGDGPREDAEPTADLPTLTPGISGLPTTCTRCGSAFLLRQPPLGSDRRGMVTCNTCGRQVCWLRPGITARLGPNTASPTPGALRATTAPPARTPRPRIRDGRFERLDGCGALCTAEYGHDARTHELHGMDRVLADLAARRTGRAATGRLVVDFDMDCVMLDGRELALPGRHRALLLLLADRLGATIRYDAVVAGLWGAAALSAADGGEMHHLRVLVARVRTRLGPAADLVQTVYDLGLRLRADPPIATEDLRP